MTNSSKTVHFLPELEAANSIFRMNADDMARKRCRDREEYYREMRGLRKRIEEKDAEIGEKDAQIEEQAAEIKKMESALEKRDTELAEKESAMAEMQAEITRLQNRLESDDE